MLLKHPAEAGETKVGRTETKTRTLLQEHDDDDDDDDGGSLV